MAEVINLNRYRKAKQRSEGGRKAEENRVKFGRTKAERDTAKSEAEKREADHDGKRLD